MKLNVPFYHQEKKLTCILACVRMILGYYKDYISEAEIGKDIKMHSFGTFETDLGPFLLNRGYKVTAYTIHLSLFGSLKLPFGAKIAEKHLKEINPAKSDRLAYISLEKYLQANGELIWQTPKMDIIKYWINKKIPCLITLNTAAMGWYYRHWDNAHAFVIEGIKKDGNLEIIDPNPIRSSGKYFIEKDAFLPAWAINARRSSDYLMVINK